MSDIVERLRAWSPLIASGLEVPAAALAAEEAAAEIERLRASNESLMNLVEEMQQEARRSFLLPTAMMAFSVILLIVVSFM